MLKKSVPRYLLLGFCCFLLWQISPEHILGEDNRITAEASVPASRFPSFEYRIIQKINEERISHGLAQLDQSALLDGTAREKSQDMISRHYFSHTDPQGNFVWKLMERNGYAYRAAGENLARNFDDADAVVSAWMASPSHRDNILQPKFQEIGVGVEKTGDSFYVTAVFGARRSGLAFGS